MVPTPFHPAAASAASAPRGAVFIARGLVVRALVALCGGLLAWCLPTSHLRADPPALEAAAAAVQQATVTLRVLPTAEQAAPAAEPAAAPANAPADAAPPQRVLVCSGTLLADGFVVTHGDLAALDGRIRITHPGGAQGEARLRVYDQFSGLALLETTAREHPGLPLATAADAAPLVGSWVVSGAAWGAEKPVVAVGNLGGVDRRLPAASLPPLLQCGLRAVQTSAGGPLVDRQGKLIGIVVAADAGDPQGWTYAVPVEHVTSLQRALVAGKVVVIPRRRPIVGLVLTQGEQADVVVVQRIDKGGPAESSGIQVGDQVLAVDGRVVRSVYQVLQPILQKKPGDAIAFQVRQGEVRREIRITLGGSIELAEADQLRGVRIANLVNPRIEIQRGDGGRLDVRRPGEVRNLGAEGDPATPPPTEEARLFERALERYGRLIVHLQDELRLRDTERDEARKQIDQLKQELELLRKQLEAASPGK